MNNTVENDFFGFPKLKWLQYTGNVGKCTSYRCQIFSEFNTPTRSSATAKSTARPSCLVGVLYDIYQETNNRSTANQALVRNWP